MNDQEKKQYLESYKKEKEKGVPFFPDIIFKDTIVVLIVFIILASLAYFVGVHMEGRANPADTNYTPRPEWYFLFLFQLLKYFPGELEVIGVMVIPGLFILLLFLLPFIDKSPKRHFMNRPYASIAAILTVAGIGVLTALSILEAPPPQASEAVDQTAALYANNCANCHGTSIQVPPGTDLHRLIAEGGHSGMPAWGGDLSTDEIDALAGFITSQRGSEIYTAQCGECHEATVFASGNLQELQLVLEQGPEYAAHKDQNVPDWKTTLTSEEHNALFNFLAAPDGQRLFELNCSGCHGTGVAFTGTESELRELISYGEQHVTMPAWKGTLNDADIETLANFVMDPNAVPAGATLFDQHCTSCHGDRIPTAPDLDTARIVIGTGGAHVTMPVWGDILTPEQLDALVAYTLVASSGSSPGAGAQLFAQNCAACHGQFGQGGPNPGVPGDLITSISSSDFLKTRDDITIRNIIDLGLPDSGMIPLGAANGGPLSDEEIDSIVVYIRSWETNPPPELPTEAPSQPDTTSAPEVDNPTFADNIQPLFEAKCKACHSGSMTLGGWDASSYQAVMTSGNNGPTVITGDASNSFLVQKLLGEQGGIMPPAGKLPEAEIQLIINWIDSGAPEK